MPAILRCDLTPGSTVHLLRLYDPSRNIGCSNESENASVKKFHYYYGDDFKVECTAGSRKYITLQEVAAELTRRISRLFLSGADGQRPVLKYHAKLATDPHFKDYLLFHEYFHGDSGRGGGASHQTGWTGLIAKLLRPPRHSVDRKSDG